MRIRSDRIRDVISAEAAVAEVQWVTGRNAGRYRFVEAGVVLRVAEGDKAEMVTRRIEDAVRAAVPHVERVLIHVEASTSPCVRYAVPLADREGGEPSFRRSAFLCIGRRTAKRWRR
jgi:divalent metal cation (Fe/Co/Zn/Cd) transporter